MENRNNNQNNREFNNQGNYNEQNDYQNYDNVENSQYNNYENYQEMNNGQVPVQQKNNYGKLFLTVFAAFALGATSVFGAQAVMGTGKALNSSVTATKEDKDNEQITVNAISKAKDAVVSIVNYQSNTSNNLESILGGSGRSGNDSGDLKAASSGSGVIYKKVGNTAYVVTNNHVVNNLSNTVTKGIVSAVNRQIPMDVDGDGKNDWNQTVIQTDAAINPGNSGGALINSEGKLIGINESKIAKATANVSAEGIGFGIPSNEVKLITEQLEQSGRVIRPALGVQLVSVNTVDSDTVKSQLKYEGKQGVVIRYVENGTPAAQAGLEKYDIITKLNGEEVKDVAAVRKYLFEKSKIGDTVKVTYYRNGEEQTTSVVVQALNTR